MLPVSTNVTVDVKPGPSPSARTEAGAVAVFVTEGSTDAGPAGELLSDAERRAVARLLAAGVSRGKPREVHFDLLDAANPGGGGKAKAGGGYRRVLVAGL